MQCNCIHCSIHIIFARIYMRIHLLFLSATWWNMFWQIYTKSTILIWAIATRPQYTAKSEIVLDWNHRTPNPAGLSNLWLPPTSSAIYSMLEKKPDGTPTKPIPRELKFMFQTFLDQFLRLQKGCFQSTQPFGYQNLRHVQVPQRKKAVIFCTTMQLLTDSHLQGFQRRYRKTHSRSFQDGIDEIEVTTARFPTWNLFWRCYGAPHPLPLWIPLAYLTCTKASQCVRHGGWTSWLRNGTGSNGKVMDFRVWLGKIKEQIDHQ